MLEGDMRLSCCEETFTSPIFNEGAFFLEDIFDEEPLCDDDFLNPDMIKYARGDDIVCVGLNFEDDDVLDYEPEEIVDDPYLEYINNILDSEDDSPAYVIKEINECEDFDIIASVHFNKLDDDWDEHLPDSFEELLENAA